MAYSHKIDPRAMRTQTALQAAFRKLLNEKPFQKISVKEITEEAGIARHTFYNHYETKDELLNSFLDEILDGFFGQIGYWDLLSEDPDPENKIGVQFFQVWLEHRDLISVLKLVDLERLLIDRLREFFRDYYYTYASENRTGMCEKMAQYVINLNAYSWASLLKQWFKDDMDTPPELLGKFLYHFIGVEPANQSIVLFNEKFKEAGLCE